MFPAMFDLSGKTALVTGSGRGIGRAVAMLLGQAGANVIFHASRPSSTLLQTLEEARSQGIACDEITGDISKLDELQTLVQKAGQPDLLILNASVQKYQTLEEFDAEEFTLEFNTNVRSSFVLMSAFLPGMVRRKFGRIVSIGSVNQWKPSPTLGIYASTKAAQMNMILNCARSYAKYGITVNNVAPGVIATDRNKAVLADPAAAENLLNRIPAARIGVPEDCAGVVLLLCSAAGSYITGADIPVAGGMQL